MPSSTFYRLPEEKRSRLMNEVWKEFTRVPYTEASINRVILGARIPRGSFYQYFEDKNDLYFYLIDLIRGEFLKLLDGTVEKAHGDLFAVPALLLNELIMPDDTVAPRFRQGFSLLACNARLDVAQVFFDRAESDLSARLLSDRVDAACLRSSEPQFIACTFSLLIGALGNAIARILSGQSTREKEYEILMLRVSIIKNGSGKEEKE